MLAIPQPSRELLVEINKANVNHGRGYPGVCGMTRAIHEKYYRNGL